jgi:hypothetical protein
MVLVGYDIHNAEKIIVRNLDGQFICHAIWNANKRDYFPKAVVEQAREKRAKGRMDRLAVKQQEVMDELKPKVKLSKEQLIAKIEALLADAGKHWNYAIGIAKRCLTKKR